MAALNEDIKRFIVQSLACFDMPSQVAEAVNDEFGIKVSRQQVQRYDPTKTAGKDLAARHVEIFNATRKVFLEDVGKIPIASQSFRLRSLQRMHDYYISRKNYVQAQSVLEQAAKEVGGIYTNKIKVGGDADNPFKIWLQEIGNSALPIVHDIEGEVIENEPKQVPAKRPTWKSK